MRLIFHWLLVIAGIIFIFTGILGLFLPIIPGILLIFLGLVTLGGKSKINQWIIKKFPEPVRIYFEIEDVKFNPLLMIILIILSFFLGLVFYYFFQLKN